MTESRQDGLSPQVDKGHYFSPEYVNPRRFASYAYQISEILALEPRSVLEVGIGNGLVTYMLRQAGLEVTTLDFDAALAPDIVASVTEMPVPDGAYDVVACFEVLEHLPFDMLPQALAEIHRAARTWAVLSLPHSGHAASAEVRLPGLGVRRLRLACGKLIPRPHRFDGEHYWQIGYKGYPLARVLTAMREAGFEVVKTYRCWEVPWHRFFVLKKDGH